MVTVIPEMSEYNTNQIIEFLDDKFASLTGVKVAILAGNDNKNFMMNLIRKLYDCGCQVTIISSTLNYYEMRELVSISDVCLSFFNNHEINDTVHHSLNAIIVDITGNSCTDAYVKIAKNNTFYKLYTSRTEF